MVASRQTKLKLKKGFVNAPLTYRKLMVAQFTPKDMKIISKGLINATTPENAKALLPQIPPGVASWMLDEAIWSLRQISSIRDYDVRLLSFKGLEVALYFQRQTSVITPEKGDPLPEGTLENPDDVWVRLDLFSKSPRQLVGSVKQELADKDVEIARLNVELDTAKSMLTYASRKFKTSDIDSIQSWMKIDPELREIIIKDLSPHEEIQRLKTELRKLKTKEKQNEKGTQQRNVVKNQEAAKATRQAGVKKARPARKA